MRREEAIINLFAKGPLLASNAPLPRPFLLEGPHFYHEGGVDVFLNAAKGAARGVAKKEVEKSFFILFFFLSFWRERIRKSPDKARPVADPRASSRASIAIRACQSWSLARLRWRRGHAEQRSANPGAGLKAL